MRERECCGVVTPPDRSVLFYFLLCVEKKEKGREEREKLNKCLYLYVVINMLPMKQ